MLTVMGSNWLNSTDLQGRPRLDASSDYVRKEIEFALQNKIWIIPVLLNNTTMPLESELPPSLGELTKREAVSIIEDHFDRDIEHLISNLIKILDAANILLASEIAHLYTTMGFHTTQPIAIADGSFALTAERHVAGVGITKLAILCLPSTTATITSEHIAAHRQALESFAHENAATENVMVSDARFDASCYSSRPRNLRLLAVPELRNALLDLTQSMLAFVSEYEREDLSRLYIDIELAVKRSDHHEHSMKSSEFIQEIIRTSRRSFYFILGDFGAGKTTLLNESGMNYQRGPSPPEHHFARYSSH